ncbi:MAG TPA: hypothetical protein VJL58_07020, partial [Pyrinomonadaceae bacterium]|nr:hypothetical protein [Pyrinomonadaceae bacterium]
RVVIKKDDGSVQELGSGEAKIFLKKAGEPHELTWKTEDAEGKHIVVERAHRAEHDGMRQNELLRMSLGLLLSSPEGMDVNYTFAGEGDVDGTSCNIVNAEFGGSSVKLYISKASSLPVMLAYKGHQMPQMFELRVDGPKSGEELKRDVVFVGRTEMTEPDTAEFQVRLSDYRGVNGVQLPYRWTTTVNGKADETFDVTTYEINPSNISEKFQHERMPLRMKTPARN